MEPLRKDEGILICWQASMNFQVGQELVKFAAKNLPQPTLFYGNSGGVKTKRPELASWNLQHVHFREVGKMESLHMLALHGCFNTDKQTEKDPNNALSATFQKLGQTIATHNIRSVTKGTNRLLTANANLEAYLTTWFRDTHKNPKDCTVILIPGKDQEIYAKIKKIADFAGKHTLCAIGSKLRMKGSEQNMSNLALKVNMKFGGDNHHLPTTELDKILGERRKGTIILGADVAHPGVGARAGSPSVACVVGSVDANFMNYGGSMRLQAGRQEVSSGPRSAVEATNIIPENRRRAHVLHGDGAPPSLESQERKRETSHLHSLLPRWCQRVAV